MSLDISNNGIGAEGATHIAELLQKKRLVKFDMNMNEVGDDGAKELAKGLKEASGELGFYVAICRPFVNFVV